MRLSSGSSVNGVWRALKRAVVPSEAELLSERIDREHDSPGRSEDALLSLLIGAADARRLPPGSAAQSWRSLERTIFPGPPIRPPLTVPFRRAASALWIQALHRVPRAVIVAAGCVAAASAVVAWKLPELTASHVLGRTAETWSRVEDYQGDIQFLCRIPHFEMQWSGAQFFALPDRMRLQIDALGTPIAMISREGVGEVEYPFAASQPAVERFRFLSRVLRVDRWIDALSQARSARYEGEGDVLDHDCDIIAFELADHNPFGLPEQARRGRVWISRRLSVPMQLEVYGSDHSVLLAYRFSRAEYNVPMDFRMFSLRRPVRRPPAFAPPPSPVWIGPLGFQ